MFINIVNMINTKFRIVTTILEKKGNVGEVLQFYL